MPEYVKIELDYNTNQQLHRFLNLFEAYVETQKELVALKKERPEDSVGGDFEEEKT